MKKTDPVDLTGKKPAVVTMVAGDVPSSESPTPESPTAEAVPLAKGASPASLTPEGLANSKGPLLTTMVTVESTVLSLKKGQKIRLVWSTDGAAEETDEGEFYVADSAKKELTYYRKAGMYKTLSFDDLVRVEVIDEYSESGPLDY